MTTSAQGTHTDAADTAFVIGPGRSGTTLLYKLLCLHPQVAYLSSIESRMPWIPLALAGRLRIQDPRRKLAHWFQGGGNAYMPHRPLLQKLIPAPLEGETVYRRNGLPADPGAEGDGATLRDTFERIRRASGSAVFVSKRTANNRRIPMLDALFPQARFLVLERDGRAVAASLSRVEWWNDHRLWWDPEHRTPLQVTASGADMLRLCARNWVEETRAIQEGLAGIDPARVCTVSFERLAAAPAAELARIVAFLGLPHSTVHDDLDSLFSPPAPVDSWRRNWSAEQTAMVNSEQAEHLNRQGYAP